jgi:hypothetical protein
MMMDAITAFTRNWVGLFEVMPKYRPDARLWREDGIVFGITGMPTAAFNAAIIEDPAVITRARMNT